VTIAKNDRIRITPTATIIRPPNTNRSSTMTTHYANPLPSSSANTGAWVMFTYIQFGLALAMTAIGIWSMPLDMMAKGYMMMAVVFTVGSTFTLAKTQRDEHESKRFVNRVEEARTEKLLAEIERRA
jgi:hypothetical protein